MNLARRLVLPVILAVLKMIFNLFFLAPLPGGVPGESTECHLSKEIGGLGPVPARIRGLIYFPPTAIAKRGSR